MTEKEAFKKMCPYGVDDPNQMSRGRCVSSSCHAWVTIVSEGKRTDEGYCIRLKADSFTARHSGSL